MKTPDEIKKGLECCAHLCGCLEGCPYDADGSCENADGVERDALAYIQQLESGIAEWEYVAASPGAVEDMAREIEWLKGQINKADACCKQLEEKYKRAMENAKILSVAVTKLERERDAAVRDVRSLCATNYFSGNYCEYCQYNEPDGQCHHPCMPYTDKWGWQWRGLCRENGGVE